LDRIGDLLENHIYKECTLPDPGHQCRDFFIMSDGIYTDWQDTIFLFDVVLVRFSEEKMYSKIFSDLSRQGQYVGSPGRQRRSLGRISPGLRPGLPIYCR
jgi:hypothetical protein